LLLRLRVDLLEGGVDRGLWGGYLAPDTLEVELLLGGAAAGVVRGAYVLGVLHAELLEVLHAVGAELAAAAGLAGLLGERADDGLRGGELVPLAVVLDLAAAAVAAAAAALGLVVLV